MVHQLRAHGFKQRNFIHLSQHGLKVEMAKSTVNRSRFARQRKAKKGIQNTLIAVAPKPIIKRGITAIEAVVLEHKLAKTVTERNFA